MAFQDLRLSLMAFAEEWIPASGLSANLIILPTGDPTVPDPQLGGGAFAGAQRKFKAVFIASLAQLPSPTAPPAEVRTFSLSVPAPSGAPALFASLAAQFHIVPPPSAQVPAIRIKKALPQSYIDAFPFEQPRTSDVIVGAGFGCALNGKPTDPRPSVPPPPIPPPPKKDISWGEVFSWALHNPDTAERLGVLYRNLLIPVTPADAANGGWLYITLEAGDPYALQLTTDAIKLYAARIPALSAKRPVFTAVLFPVVATIGNPAPYDVVEVEAQNYDDGFAKIVHCDQPSTIDAAAGDDTQIVPGTDAGIQIGWDDEQVTIWNNRQLDILRARRNLGAPPPDAEVPLGVLGYRVDVMDAKTGKWVSLCAKEGTQPPPEESLHPAPMRSTEATDLEAWLPRYFAQWRGKSLVSQDIAGINLTGGKKTLAGAIPKSVLPQLLFGNSYQFRVRLADLSGGGPLLADSPQNPAPANSVTCPFKRFLPPKAARLQTTPSGGRALAKMLVWRPLIGYPELLFTGVDPSAVDTMLAQVASAKATRQPLGANDPDANKVRVTVEARTPAHDSSDPDSLDGPFRQIYQFECDFPPFPADPVPPTPGTSPAAEAIEFDLQPVDIANIATMTAPAVTLRPASQPLPIPTARDVRILITPLASNANPAYFGNDRAKSGLTSHIDVRLEASAEDNLFVPEPDALELAAIFLQPPANNFAANELAAVFNLTPPQTTTDPAQLLGQQLAADANGLTFAGKPGQRTVFGASLALRHNLNGDHSQITLAAQGELLSKWILAIKLELNRDWTWDGFADQSFTVAQQVAPSGALVDIGTLELRQTVADTALAGPFPNRRDTTRLIFLHAFDPHPPANGFPVLPDLKYRVTPHFKTLPTPPAKELEITLPIAAAPAQTPVLVSAGFALTPYQAAADYSSTAPRSRALWLEFDSPPLDPQDSYFARVLAYGVDPLLTSFSAGAAEPNEPPLGIDPEPIRVIAPGASIDTAGLDAMVPLVQSKFSKKHYLLPLPPGLTENSPELLGFWTYELRVGHNLDPNTQQPVWSTAQARYGRPLRVTGTQHPAPPLRCHAVRSIAQKAILATAPFATPVLNGRVLFPERPSSRLWVLLYTQVLQADGTSQRNILLLRKAAEIEQGLLQTNPVGVATFGEAEVEAALFQLALPSKAPLSVLAVELLPAPNESSLTDPLGVMLGQQRILRTSPLVKVAETC